MVGIASNLLRLLVIVASAAAISINLTFVTILFFTAPIISIFVGYLLLPLKLEKVNIKKTVKELIKIYLVLTVIGIIMLMLSGMTLWQATNYSMSSISTAGFDLAENELASQNYGWSTEGIRNYWVDISLIIIMFFIKNTSIFMMI